MTQSTDNQKANDGESAEVIKPMAIPEAFRRNTVHRCLYLLLGAGFLGLLIVVALWNVNLNDKSLFRTVVGFIPLGGKIEIPTDEKKYALLAVAVAFLTSLLYSFGLVVFHLVPFGFRLRHDLWKLQGRIQAQAPGELVSLVKLGSDGIRPTGRLMVRLQMLERAYQLFGTRSAVKEANNQLSALDETTTAYALQPLVWCEWLLPILGFIGTVYGITQAVDGLRQGIVIYFNEQQLSDPVMRHFADGFSGLAVAFQTTLLALWGLLFVGLVNFLLRMNATQTLVGVEKWCHEAIGLLREAPAADPLERLIRTGIFETNEKEELVIGEDQKPVPRDKSWREAIQKLLDAGLFYKLEGDKDPKSLIVAVREAIVRGLLRTEKGAKEDEAHSLLEPIHETLVRALLNPNDGQSYLPGIRETLTAEIRQSAALLAGLERAILYESIKRTFIQYKLIAPPLHVLSRRFSKQHTDQEFYLIKPSISTVAELDANCDIQALALARSASRACVGGVKKDMQEFFVYETAIDWKQDTYSLVDGVRFEGHPIEREKGPEVLARIGGITYHPETLKLFVMCHNGELRSWLDGRMDSVLPTKIMTLLSQPFGWISNSMRNPLMARWELDSTGQEFQLALSPINEDFSFTNEDEFQAALESMNGDEHRADQAKFAVDIDVLCLGICRKLYIGGTKGGRVLKLLGHQSLASDVVAVDVSAAGGFVAYALSDGSLFTWRLDGKESPIPLSEAKTDRRIVDIFLGETGSSLAVLYQGAIVLYDLLRPQVPRIFDTGEDEAIMAARSPDRRNLLVATKNNVIKLFNFGLKL